MNTRRLLTKMYRGSFFLFLLVVACSRSQPSNKPSEPVLTPLSDTKTPSIPTGDATPRAATPFSVTQVPYKPQVFSADESHTRFGFTAATALFDVKGSFPKYDLFIEGDPVNPSTHPKIRVELDASAINTENEGRDKHLRSKDFFDVEKYPKIVFVSNKIWQADNELMVEGTLQMHGVEQPLTLKFTQKVGKNGAGVVEHVYSGTLSINRNTYGIGVDSVAAKITLQNMVQLDLLLAGFWQDASPKNAK